MATQFMGKLRLLAGTLALVGSVSAHAAPATVHFALYDASGSIVSRGGSTATGDVGSGSSWINNPTLATAEHLTDYLVKFWIDPVVNLTNVTWNFDWGLAHGSTFLAKSPTNLREISLTTSLSIGTAQTDWRGVSGTIIASDSFASTLAGRQKLAAGATYVFGDAADTASQQVGSYMWQGGDTTTVWAYMSADSFASAGGSYRATFSAFANVKASADVTIAQPLAPDNVVATDGNGGAVPEPGSLALLLGAGLVAMARRRRDRLKP